MHWPKPAAGFGSTRTGRPRDLTAGKLTPKLSCRVADVRGRPGHRLRIPHKLPKLALDVGTQAQVVIRLLVTALGP